MRSLEESVRRSDIICDSDRKTLKDNTQIRRFTEGVGQLFQQAGGEPDFLISSASHKRLSEEMTEAPKEQPMITAVIPAYNEEKTIAGVVSGALKHAAEAFVVDDGSVDRNVDIAIEAGARVISIPRNIGKGHALSIGLTTAALSGSEIVVCLDSDGQHGPNDIPKIVEPIADGRADMVIGSRFLDAHSRELIPAYRRVGQGILTIATNMGSAVKITDSQSGYRAFRGTF